MNFFEVTKDSNASQVSSKNNLCLLLMEFLPSFQTRSTGFLSGLQDGGLIDWTRSRELPQRVGKVDEGSLIGAFGVLAGVQRVLARTMGGV